MLPKSRKQILPVLAWVAFLVSLAAFFSSRWVSPGGLGILGGESIKTIEKDQHGVTTKRLITREEGKTVWDWLSLLGAPLSLAVLGYFLQQLQQQKAEEEALQLYYDRLSTLLIEKVLLALPSKANKTEQETQLMESAKDIFRARTLSVLRRYSNDPRRKESVIRFLIDTEILSKLKVSLRSADLCSADLRGADLRGADLRGADLYEANLSGADLSEANLSGANLAGTNLTLVNLEGANLSWACILQARIGCSRLSGADFSGADLSQASLDHANLSGAKLIEANLSFARLDHAILSEAKLVRANLFLARLIQADLSGADLKLAFVGGAKLGGIKLSGAKNLPDKLRKEMG